MTDHLFKRIVDPNNSRKKLLESSKEIIHILKSYQKILDIRKQRTQARKELKVQIKEINLFLDKVRDLFPPEVIAIIKPKSKPKKGKKKGSKKEKSVGKKPAVSEITKLENKLSSIENKLKNLS